jgi:hypothetical protein
MYLYEMPSVVYVPVAVFVKFALTTSAPPEKGMNVQTLDAVRTRLPPFDVARVSGVPLIVTPAAATTVTVPTPRFKRLTVSPAFHATVACAGTVTVTAAAFDSVTVRPLSVNDNE